MEESRGQRAAQFVLGAIVFAALAVVAGVGSRAWVEHQAQLDARRKAVRAEQLASEVNALAGTLQDFKRFEDSCWTWGLPEAAARRLAEIGSPAETAIPALERVSKEAELPENRAAAAKAIARIRRR